MYTLRCRKCRCQLGVEDSLLTWHGEKLDGESKETCNLSDGAEENNSVWFIDLETSPSWIQNLVTKAKWMKGKLVCPKCQGRLGSFDFIKTLKCPCLNHELPSIHILKARVDADTTFNLDESNDFRVTWPNSPSLTKDLSQNQQRFFQTVNIQNVGSTNKTGGHSQTIRTPNLQLIDNSQDIHRPIKILEIPPMAKTEEISQSFRLYRTWPRSDIQKDNLPVRALDVHSGSCFGTTCAAKVEDQEQMSLMDYDLRWNSVLGSVNLQNEESSALRGIDLLGWHQESNAVNLSKISSHSLDKNIVDVCRNKNNTSYSRIERSNSSINKDTTQTTNYLVQNRTEIYGDNSGNQSISGSIEDVLPERDLYPDLPSSSSTTRRRKDRRKNRFTVLQDQTPSEVHSSSSSKQEDDTQAVLVIPEENLCAVCLDLYFSPHQCYPCLHAFCEPCLRRLACNQPTNTTCPLCRVVIEHCIPDQDLDHRLRIQFAKAYRARKHEERKVQQEYYQLPQKGFYFFHYPRNRLLRASLVNIPYMMFKIVFYFLLVYVMFVGVTAIIHWQIYPALTNEEFSAMSNSHLSPRTGRSTVIR